MRLFWLIAPLVMVTGVACGEIRMERINNNETVIRAAGLGAGRLDVFVDAEGAPAMLGAQAVRDGDAVFVPRFPFTPGMKYRAVFYPSTRKSAAVHERFAIPAVNKPSVGRVAAVYPTTSALPENQLKIYVEFSVPMSRGEAYKRVRLKDSATGKEVSLAFLEIEEELWDRDTRRLTLLLDPGRIKRGLVPHNEVGSAIVAGRTYTLEIDGEWQDAEGRPLVEGFTKQFRGVEADRVAPEIASWNLIVPAAGTRSPLVVAFGEPMDRALLERMIRVVDASSGRDVPGAAEITQEEGEWRFVPAESWAPGTHQLRVNAALEDLAANRMGRLFDVDRFDRVDKKLESSTLDRPFVISPRQ